MKWFRLKLNHPTQWHVWNRETGTAYCGTVRRNVVLGMNAESVNRVPASNRCLVCIRHLATYLPDRGTA